MEFKWDWLETVGKDRKWISVSNEWKQTNGQKSWLILMYCLSSWIGLDDGKKKKKKKKLNGHFHCLNQNDAWWIHCNLRARPKLIHKMILYEIWTVNHFWKRFHHFAILVILNHNIETKPTSSCNKSSLHLKIVKKAKQWKSESQVMVTKRSNVRILPVFGLNRANEPGRLVPEVRDIECAKSVD